MERTRHAGVRPVSFPWSDVGTWDAVWDVLPRDSDGNALRGRVEVVGTTGSLIHNEGEQVTAVVGLEDVVVVETDDALLVASRERAQDVKLVVEALKAAGRTDLV